MPQMTPVLLQRFGAIAGAYSTVTNRESTGDSSVTVDKDEKIVLQLAYQGLDVFTRKGSGIPDGKPERFQFAVHARHNPRVSVLCELAIAYPKQEKMELRLYMSRGAGFHGDTDDVFYIFYTGTGEPHVGFMAPTAWAELEISQDIPEPGGAIDLEDEQYQRFVYSTAAGQPVATTGRRYPRDPRAALEAMETAGFRCELDTEHETFFSQATGWPYVEAHHLMPVSCQDRYETNLDVPANIIAVCPNCHRRLHLEQRDTRIRLLVRLYEERSDRLAAAGLSFGLADLISAYGVV